MIPPRLLGLRPRVPDGDRLREAFGGRAVVITGSTRGVGLATAQLLTRAGAVVVGLARGSDGTDRTNDDDAAAAGNLHRVDLRDTDAASAAAHRILAEHGAPALIVANAGHSIRRGVVASTGRAHDAARTMGANYLGHVALLLELLPAMVEAGLGRVVVSSSAAAALPAAGWSSYTASKVALETWVRCADAELRPSGVTLGVVRLPLVRTAMSAPTAGYRGSPAMRPQDAAALLARSALGTRRLIAPTWSRFADVVEAVSPGRFDGVTRRWDARLSRADADRAS